MRFLEDKSVNIELLSSIQNVATHVWYPFITKGPNLPTTECRRPLKGVPSPALEPGVQKETETSCVKLRKHTLFGRHETFER